MVIKKQSSTPWFPAEDEGWWESVIADEEKRPLSQVASRPLPVQQESSKPEPVAKPSVEITRPKPDWDRVRVIYDKDQIVELTVTGFNRGGLLVEDTDIQGFVPYSHLLNMSAHADEDRDAFLSHYVNKKISLKVIECVPEEGRIVFSERAAKSEAGCRTRLFEELRTGQNLSGEVTNVTDFGAFIDLGGVEGLIHISELSWGRVVHPADIVKVGQRVDVQVMEVSPERCRVALSMKRLQPNPWLTVESRYPLGAIILATITTVASYGAFARLEEGLEGLIHVTEMELPDGRGVRDIFKTGESVQVRILQVDASHQRLGLSTRLDGN